MNTLTRIFLLSEKVGDWNVAALVKYGSPLASFVFNNEREEVCAGVDLSKRIFLSPPPVEVPRDALMRLFDEVDQMVSKIPKAPAKRWKQVAKVYRHRWLAAEAMLESRRKRYARAVNLMRRYKRLLARIYSKGLAENAEELQNLNEEWSVTDADGLEDE